MAWRSENGKWLGIRRLTEDDFLDFFDPQQNQISYQHLDEETVLMKLCEIQES